MVGVTEKITFPHTLVGMVPEYPAEPVSALGDRNLARAVLSGARDSVVRSESNPGHYRQDRDQSGRHHQPRPAPVQWCAFVRNPTMPVMIR